MAIKTSSAKSKGRKLQQAVRDAILEAFPSLAASDVVSCPMGSHGADIQLSAEAARSFGYNVECKARAKIALVYDALAQASTQNDRQPIAVIKADRKRSLVVMDLDHFISLVANTK